MDEQLNNKLKFIENNKNSNRLNQISNSALDHFNNDRYDEAIEEWLTIFNSIFNSINDNKALFINVCNNIALSYIYLKDYGHAIEYCNHSKFICQK